MYEREVIVVSPQTFVVYSPFAQRLNVVVLRFTVRCNVGGCFWWIPAGQMHSVGRCPLDRWSPHQLHWTKPVNHLSSVSSTVSMTILVVLSMMSLSCGTSMTSGPVDVVSAYLELSVWPLASVDVRTSFSKEYSLDVFVREAVCRDLPHNLPDWGLGPLVVCFVSLLGNCQVSEDH